MLSGILVPRLCLLYRSPSPGSPPSVSAMSRRPCRIRQLIRLVAHSPPIRIRAGSPRRAGSGDRHRGRTGRAGHDRDRLLGCRRGVPGGWHLRRSGAAAGGALGRLGPRAARIIGGVVAGYLALASGEMLPPGTMQWCAMGAVIPARLRFPWRCWWGASSDCSTQRHVRWELAMQLRMGEAGKRLAERIDDEEFVECPASA